VLMSMTIAKSAIVRMEVVSRTGIRFESVADGDVREETGY